MSSLYAKLSAALIAIIVVVGSGFVLIQQRTTTSYYEELTQRLNAPIAMYVTGEQNLLREDGSVDEEAMRTLGRRAMIINPTVEVYLLDTDGRILAHALPPETVALDAVDIEPVRRLVAGGIRLPLRGDDPRNPRTRKIFSAAEVRVNGDLRGYLYVVLGGRKYDELVSSIRGSYSFDLGLWAVAVLIALGCAVGVLVFALLTRRLRRLLATVGDLGDSEFETAIPEYRSGHGNDEIEQLGRAFNAMAVHIGQLVDRLKETDRIRRDLVTNVSHDLRTPLASMQGYIDTLLIKNGDLSREERERCLRTAQKNTQRLRELIDDLFELSKLDSANVTPRFERFSLAELLQDTAQEFELSANNKCITLDVAAPGDRAEVYADIGLIQRVLENLIKNAIHFTPEGGRIGIELEKRSESVAVSVSDTGCGIAEAYIGRVFERFYRRDNGITERAGSAGLGLAIVKRILDLHGSRITVISEVDQGTRFEFDLKRTPAAA